MSMYGDILNKIDDSLFMKIEPGRPAHIRLLDHPWLSQQQFVDKTTGESRISTRFTWPVWDYDQQRVRVLTQGKSVFKQVASASDTWPQGDDMPSPFDLIIKRTGTGQFDTEYTVAVIPHNGTMPKVAKKDLPDMAERSKGIPIQQVLEGKKAPVIGAGGMAALPEPKTPTNADVVIEELDTEAPVNLDEIPF